MESDADNFALQQRVKKRVPTHYRRAPLPSVRWRTYPYAQQIQVARSPMVGLGHGGMGDMRRNPLTAALLDRLLHHAHVVSDSSD